MIEDLARSAAADARTSSSVDVEAGLRDLYSVHHRRRHRARWGAVGAVVVALGIGWWGGQAMTRGPAAQHPSHPGPSPHAGSPTCAPLVRCLGSSTYLFELTRPVRWHVVPGFQANAGAGTTPWLVESYSQHSGPGSGVSVLEKVRVPTPDGSSVQAGVPDTPHAFVEWLAERPYLSASAITQTSIDGRPAWRVRVTLRAGAGQGPGICTSQYACHLVMRMPDGQAAGIWGDMMADYTALRVPGAGTTVVWSWAFGRDRDLLAHNRTLVHGLSWPSG